MSRTWLSLSLGFILVISLSPVYGQEMIKEGSSVGMNVYAGTFTTIPMGQDRIQMNYELHGVVIDSTADNHPFRDCTFRCLGALHAIQGAFDNNSGFCEYVRPDGDKIYIKYTSKGRLGGGEKGNATFVGGTGKCQGITGNSEYEAPGGFRPAAQNTFQGVSKFKGSWKIP